MERIPNTVLVLGGGLAGLSAACELAARGRRVHLVEQRPHTGGKVFSFPDRTTGHAVDNGQHVFLGCCTALSAFLHRVGAADRAFLQRRLRVRFIGPGGRTAELAGNGLPAPLHLLFSFAGFPFLSWREKFSAGRALASIALAGTEAREKMEDETFGDWLRARGQSDRSVRAFWDVIVVATLNAKSDAVSAAAAAMVFRESLLLGSRGGLVGYARTGQSRLYTEPAVEYITARGGQVTTGVRATGLVCVDGRVTGASLADGHTLAADAVVSALPFDTFPDLLPADMAEHPFFARARELEPAPIVGVHLWYDRCVFDGDFAAFPESEIQWLFNKSRILGLPGPGQYLSLSVSDAGELASLGKPRLVERMDAAIRDALPRARRARREHAVVVVEKAATFRPSPGTDALRPPARTPVPGLVLAGAWTATGWPATMEGAVRSGVTAADAVLAPR